MSFLTSLSLFIMNLWLFLKKNSVVCYSLLLFSPVCVIFPLVYPFLWRFFYYFVPFLTILSIFLTSLWRFVNSLSNFFIFLHYLDSFSCHWFVTFFHFYCHFLWGFSLLWYIFSQLCHFFSLACDFLLNFFWSL